MFGNQSDAIIRNLFSEACWAEEEARIKGAEIGRAFYENTVTIGALGKQFFPAKRFSGADLISLPIYSTVINKITNSMRNEIYYEKDAKIDALYSKYDLDNVMNIAMKNSLMTGSTSLWLEKSDDKLCINNWNPWYTFKLFSEDGKNVIGYMKRYVIDNQSLLSPLVKSGSNAIEYIEIVSSDNKWVIYQDGKPFYDENYNMPMMPVVWFDSIDMDDDNRYGIPFVDRFKNILIALNQLLTSSQRMMLCLPNTWYTTKDFQDSDNEISIRPDMINYVGSDKELAQTARELDLNEEKDFIEKYINSIYESSQLPPKEILSGAGKVESGIALSIIYSSFISLISSISTYGQRKEAELIKALYFMEYGRELKDFEVKWTNNILPKDRDADLLYYTTLFDKNIITADELKDKLI